MIFISSNTDLFKNNVYMCFDCCMDFSLVAEIESCSSLQCVASHCGGFSCYRARTPRVHKL